MSFFPNSKLGKYAMWMTLLFILITGIFFISMVIGWVTFDDALWWKLTIGLSAPVAGVSLVLSVLAIIKKNEHSIWNYFTIALGVAVILFLLSQSLFI